MCQDGSAEFISASYKTPHKKAAHVKRMRRLYPNALFTQTSHIKNIRQHMKTLTLQAKNTRLCTFLQILCQQHRQFRQKAL